jgi:nickel/cobalt exporter
MEDFSNLLQQGASNAWLFVPTAIFLGALHGLEPGHSKTMMAAFIVAIRGTVTQAILLGLAATISHTAVVWLIAMGGLYIGKGWNAEASEPYFQVISAILMIGIAAWMLYRTIREQRHAADGHHHDHDHEETFRIDTGHGVMAELTIKEENVPPRFWLAFEKFNRLINLENQTCSIETIRSDGTRQNFEMVNMGAYFVSADTIPEPHDFTARLSIHHDNHGHEYDVEFKEHNHTHHDHDGLDVTSSSEYQDAHERAHANDIRRRFANKNVTTAQIIVFGLTGGLIPCPAAITVLLLCLQLKEFTLGAALVVCFSIGLALTMVVSGVIAAMSVKYASKRFSGFGTFARRAPYFSSALIMLIGLYMGYHGLVNIGK